MGKRVIVQQDAGDREGWRRKAGTIHQDNQWMMMTNGENQRMSMQFF